MADIFISGASWVFILAGSFFYLIGALGLVRMPDVFTRIHATSVSDTMGAGLLVVGMMIQAGWSLVGAKLLIILAILVFTGPVATHALARAAIWSGLSPQLAENRVKGRKRQAAARKSRRKTSRSARGGKTPSKR